MTHSRRA